MEWWTLVISILSGLIVTIPLVVKLVEYVKKAVQEKRWDRLLALVMKLMAEAEEKFDNGADRKEWVLGMVGASADIVDYAIDLEQVSELIDSLCAMSKKVNPPKEVTE
jgi:uncharacterized protein (DUF111 family)